MIGQVIRLKVKPGMQAEFETLVSQLMHDVTTHEPGSIYDIRRVRDQERTYSYFISFPDQAAFDRYMTASYHTDMSPKALAMLDGDPIIEDLDPLDG